MRDRPLDKRTSPRSPIGGLITATIALILTVTACGSDDAASPTTAAAPTTSTAAPSTTAATTTTTTTAPLPPLQKIVLTTVATDLGQPVAGSPLPGSEHLIVLDRKGRVIDVDPATGATSVALQLDDVLSTGSWERGLLGLAVHPEFETNHLVYLSYSRASDASVVIAEARATATDPLVLDPGSLRTLLDVEQPGDFHQGGTLAFDDFGLLWIALGDGGSPRQEDGTIKQDAYGWARTPHRVQGTLLRIDVDGGDPYAIPPDNPFADGESGAPEVWAFGFRNPWGISFDQGRLFVADVGHISWEEIDVVELATAAGSDFGWSMWEGPECFEDRPCEEVDAVLPALAIRRPDFCAVIGGRVYRGSAIPEVSGQYFFADLCSGRIRSAPIEDTTFLDQIERVQPDDSFARITGFVEDLDGELYVLDFLGGLHRIDPIR